MPGKSGKKREKEKGIRRRRKKESWGGEGEMKGTLFSLKLARLLPFFLDFLLLSLVRDFLIPPLSPFLPLPSQRKILLQIKSWQSLERGPYKESGEDRTAKDTTQGGEEEYCLFRPVSDIQSGFSPAPCNYTC